ncbi:MAG: uridine kinase [Microthrixaceae bacterium]
MEPAAPYVIGIAGGSGSGKTTVTRSIIEADGVSSVTMITVDSYYFDQSDRPMAERAKVNYDAPEAFEWPLVHDHLSALRSGRAVDVPVYDFTTHTRSPLTERAQPGAVVVIDGILVLHDPALRQLLDLAVYLDVDDDLRFIRRLERDVAERGRTTDTVVQQYLTTVRPSHLQFVEPTRRFADVVIPHGGRNAPAISMLVALIRERVGLATSGSASPPGG